MLKENILEYDVNNFSADECVFGLMDRILEIYEKVIREANGGWWMAQRQ